MERTYYERMMQEHIHVFQQRITALIANEQHELCISLNSMFDVRQRQPTPFRSNSPFERQPTPFRSDSPLEESNFSNFSDESTVDFVEYIRALGEQANNDPAPAPAPSPVMIADEWFRDLEEMIGGVETIGQQQQQHDEQHEPDIIVVDESVEESEEEQQLQEEQQVQQQEEEPQAQQQLQQQPNNGDEEQQQPQQQNGEEDNHGPEYDINVLLALDDEPRELICSICQHNALSDRPIAISCGHTFHLKCLAQWMTIAGTCPNCRFATDIRRCALLI